MFRSIKKTSKERERAVAHTHTHTHTHTHAHTHTHTHTHTYTHTRHPNNLKETLICIMYITQGPFAQINFSVMDGNSTSENSADHTVRQRLWIFASNIYDIWSPW